MIRLCLFAVFGALVFSSQGVLAKSQSVGIEDVLLRVVALEQGSKNLGDYVEKSYLSQEKKKDIRQVLEKYKLSKAPLKPAHLKNRSTQVEIGSSTFAFKNIKNGFVEVNGKSFQLSKTMGAEEAIYRLAQIMRQTEKTSSLWNALWPKAYAEEPGLFDRIQTFFTGKETESKEQVKSGPNYPTPDQATQSLISLENIRAIFENCVPSKSRDGAYSCPELTPEMDLEKTLGHLFPMDVKCSQGVAEYIKVNTQGESTQLDISYIENKGKGPVLESSVISIEGQDGDICKVQDVYNRTVEKNVSVPKNKNVKFALDEERCLLLSYALRRCCAQDLESSCLGGLAKSMDEAKQQPSARSGSPNDKGSKQKGSR